MTSFSLQAMVCTYDQTIVLAMIQA